MVTIIYGFRRFAGSLAIMAVLALLAVSCGDDVSVESNKTDDGDCRLVFDVSFSGYKGESTRADIPVWKNGDRLYFKFVGDNTTISVRAVFDSNDNDWKLSYDGVFPSGNYSGESVFIDGETQELDGDITFGPNVGIYRDEKVICEKSANQIKVTALLRPMLGRLRFHASDPCQFTVSGVMHNYKLRLSDLEFETSETPVNCTIGEDGFSKYIYGSMPETSRDLSIGYNNQLYTTISLLDRILDAGISGVMELPNEANHNGWNMTILSTPELGEIAAYDIGVSYFTIASSIVNNGNGTVSECGFCYSRSVSPTVNDAKVSCGKPSGTLFSKTISGLDENTPYHVRAYAVNESGVFYSQELIVTTLAISLPIVSVTTVKVEEGSTSASLAAQIISEGNGNITECGFCYATFPLPDITHNKLKCDVSPSFDFTLNSLAIGTKYYVRAYAINENGVGYGEQVSFIGGGGKPTDDDIVRPNMIKRKK